MIFRFAQSDLESVLENASKEDRELAALMARNLLFDLEYVFRRLKNLDDVAALKKLLLEADKKFYAEDELTAKAFRIQPITLESLDGLKKRSDGARRIKAIDAAIERLKEKAEKLSQMPEKMETLLPKLLAEAAKDYEKMKEAEEKAECAKVMTVIIEMSAIIVAVVVSVFSFGAGSVSTALAVIDAAAIIEPNAAVAVTSTHIIIGKKKIPIPRGKVDFKRVDLDKSMKCSMTTAAAAVLSSVYGDPPYPAKPRMASVALSILAITGNIEEIETVCR